MVSDFITSYLKTHVFGADADMAGHFASVNYEGQTVFLNFSGTDEMLTISCGVLEFQIKRIFYPEYQAMRWQTAVVNRSGRASGMLSEFSVLDVEIPLPVQEPVVHRGILGDSCTSESFLPFEEELICGSVVRKKPYGGKSSHYAFPFFDLWGKEDGLICGIGWSGTWFYEIGRTEKGLRIKAGLPEAEFYMEPGERLQLPSILLMACAGTYTQAHNQFRSLMRKYLSPQERFDGKPGMPISLQNFDRYTRKMEFWNTEEGQLQEIAYGEMCRYCDTYWLDAAWFTGGFPKGVGNYTFREGFPNGLAKITADARQKGMRTMIWFEPERIAAGTEVEREHPEFVLSGPITDPDQLGGCGGRLLDLSNPDVVDWLTEKIAGFIETYQIDILRHDFNIYPDSFWRAKDTNGRKGITELRYIEGLYRFWDTLLTRFPHLLIDCCASGGNRMDLECCMRCIFCWRSDTGCSPATKEHRGSEWNQNQNLSLSSYIVYHGSAVWDARAYDVRSAMTEGIAPNFDVFDPACDFDALVRIFEECSRLRQYWTEDFYPLSEADLREDHWSMCQFGTQERGVMLAFRRELDAHECQIITFQGLDADREYFLRISDEAYQVSECRVRGEKLLAGYAFELKEPRSSLAVEYFAVEPE